MEQKYANVDGYGNARAILKSGPGVRYQRTRWRFGVIVESKSILDAIIATVLTLNRRTRAVLVSSSKAPTPS